MPVKIIANGSPDEKGNVTGKIEIDGKEFSASDVENIIEQQKAATQKAQEVAGILAAAEKYGVDVETYIAQAEGAFGVMSDLIKEKVIDEKGNIVKVKEPLVKTNNDLEGDDDLMKLLNLSKGDTHDLKGADKVAAIIAKALEPQFDVMKKLEERVAAVDKTQGDMIRLNLQEKVMSKFPVLKSSDVSQVFGSAMNDKSKSLWEHAEAFSKMKETELGELKKAHAKEFGIDLEKFNENKLREQEAKGGAGVMFKGKKFSFDAKKDDPDTVDPRKAAMEYLEAGGGEAPEG